MSTPQDEFAQAFNATAAELAEGKTGAGAINAPAPDEEELKKAAEKAAASEAAPPATDDGTKGDDAEKKAAEEAAAKEAAEKAADTTVDDAEKKAAEEAAAKEAADKATAEEAAKKAAEDDPTAKAIAAAKEAADKAIAESDKKHAEELAKLRQELGGKATTDDPAAKEAAEKAAADKAAAEEAAKPKPYEYSEDEQKKLEEFKKEWEDFPEIFELHEKKIRHEMRSEIVGSVEALLKNFAQSISGSVAPVVSAHLQSEQEKHFAAVRAKHADYDEVVDLVPEWIKKQPAYLQSVYNDVYEKGATADVIDLFTKFKQETGRVQPQSPGTESSSTLKPAAQKLPPDDKKVTALTAVDSKRTGVKVDNQAPVEDFAAAFNATVKELTAARR